MYNYTNTTLKLIFWQSFVNQREVVPHRLLYVLVRWCFCTDGESPRLLLTLLVSSAAASLAHPQVGHTKDAKVMGQGWGDLHHATYRVYGLVLVYGLEELDSWLVTGGTCTGCLKHMWYVVWCFTEVERVLHMRYECSQSGSMNGSKSILRKQIETFLILIERTFNWFIAHACTRTYS